MAIAFRAAASVNVQATSAAITIPGACQVGDTVYILVQTGGIGGALSVPSGWTGLGNLNSGTTWYAQAVKKVLTVSDLGANVTWATPGSGVKTGILLVAYSGIDTASDYDDIDFAVTSTGTSHVTPTITTTAGTSWVAGLYLERNTSPVVTPPGAFALRASCTDTGGASIVGSAVDSNGATTAGAQNAGTFTSTVSSNNGVTLVLGLKAAASVGATATGEAYDSVAAALWKGDFDTDTNTYKMVLMGAGYTFNKATHVYYSDISAQECATSNGYTAGGVTLTGVQLVADAPNHRSVFDSDPAEWVASGGDLPSTKGAVILAWTGSASTSRLLWWLDAGGTIASGDLSIGLTVAPDPNSGWGYIETPVP